MQEILVVGNIFRIRRNKRRETLADVAKRTGISLGYLSQFEKGNANLSLEKLRICVIEYGLTGKEIKKLRQIIFPIVRKKPQRLTDKEILSYQI